jgi:hypothetical protein
MRNLLIQYFGDGEEDTFVAPTLASGFVLDIQVGGESVDFEYDDTDVVLADAPADRAIISMYETNEIVVAKEVHTGSMSSPEQAGAVAVPGVQGNTVAFPKTSEGVTTVLEAADVDRTVIIAVTITEDFEHGTGTEPTFTIGETSSASKFAAITALIDEVNVPVTTSVGLNRVFHGTLSATKDLIVTAVAATGDSTGAFSLSVIAVPKA